MLDTSSAISNSENWRRATLLRLIESTQLRMLSVWSPTFLSAVIEPLLNAAQRAATMDWLCERLSTPRRTALRRALDAGDFEQLWPELQIISCWMDGPSRDYAQKLADLFPRCRLVPKGLFATEGVVSIPWGITNQCPLAIDSHVLEFLDASGEVHAAHELLDGHQYQPLLTTSGGLYRYCLGDVIEVDGFINQTPCVRFCGRSDARCDLTGEKLDESLVADALAVLPRDICEAVLVPMPDEVPLRYLLLLGSSRLCEAGHMAQSQLAADVEAQLIKIFHYGQARQTGQLARLAVCTVSSTADVIQRSWEALGRRAGDSKPTRLITSLPQARALLKNLASGVVAP
jgi:hypothetical protein